MTIEPWREDSILLRFEHTFEKNEDPEYSKPARFNFENVFRSFDIASIREVTLSANQWIEDAKRFKFRPDPELPGQSENLSSQERFIQMATESNSKLALDYEVVLNPMQIRTFIVTLNS
jgi:lysosomal alpha-mannosidase